MLDLKFKYQMFESEEDALDRLNIIIKSFSNPVVYFDIETINSLHDEMNFIIQTLEGFRE